MPLQPNPKYTYRCNFCRAKQPAHSLPDDWASITLPVKTRERRSCLEAFTTRESKVDILLCPKHRKQFLGIPMNPYG